MPKDFVQTRIAGHISGRTRLAETIPAKHINFVKSPKNGERAKSNVNMNRILKIVGAFKDPVLNFDISKVF